MQTASTVCAVLVIAVSALGAAAQHKRSLPQSPQQSAVQLGASVIAGSSSACEISPQRPPRTISLAAGASVSYSGCSELDSAHPTPIAITVRNADSTAIDLQLPPLADVQIRTGQGFRPAIALWLRLPGGPVPMPSSFVREMRGIEVRVPARDSIQLLYLFPTPTRRATIRVGSLGQVTLPAN